MKRPICIMDEKLANMAMVWGRNIRAKPTPAGKAAKGLPSAKPPSRESLSSLA